MTTGQTNVTTSATKILTSPSEYKRGWTIRNLDATNPIYVGIDNTVSSTTGFLVKAGETLSIPFTGDVWMVSTGGTVAICWMGTQN